MTESIKISWLVVLTDWMDIRPQRSPFTFSWMSADALTLRLIDCTFVKIWPAVPHCQYIPGCVCGGGGTLSLWLTASRNKPNTCYAYRKRTVCFCWFSHSVQCLTNKWSVTKNRAHSEGKAPMGLQTTAVLACIWSTKLMNTTKRERGVTCLVFNVVYLSEETGIVDRTTTLVQLGRHTVSVLSVVTRVFISHFGLMIHIDVCSLW